MASRDLRTSPLEPRGLSRVDAAAYVGISATLFDSLVAAGLMPRPKALAGRNVWDRRELDRAFDDLPTRPDSRHHVASDADGEWSDARA